jgi:hypothetical protein
VNWANALGEVIVNASPSMMLKLTDNLFMRSPPVDSLLMFSARRCVHLPRGFGLQSIARFVVCGLLPCYD